MSVELAVLNVALARRDLSLLVRNGLDESSFPEQVDAYRFILGHVQAYGETPDTLSVVKACPTFEAIGVVESPETLIAKLHDRNVKLAGRRIVETYAKRFATDDGRSLLEYLEGEVGKLRSDVNRRTSNGAANWSRNVDERLSEYERRANHEHGVSIPLFWSEIDEAVGAFHRGDYVNIEAAMGVGKSWMADVAGLTANRAGFRVLSLKAESNKVESLSRLDTLEFGISNRGIHAGTLDSIAYQTYVRKLEEMKTKNRADYVIETPEDWPMGLTMSQIESSIDRWQPDVVIIDQFNLVRHGGSDHSDKANTSRALKLTFARRQVVGVVITQANGDYVKRLNKANEGEDVRELSPPRLGDYSETIAVRQDCTHMLALDAVTFRDTDGKQRGKAKIVVEKSRTGGEGTEVDLEWCPNDGVIRPREATDVF